MKHRLGRFALLLAWIILGLPSFVSAEQQQPLRVGSKIGFAPYADIDDQGRSIGFAVELFAAVAAAVDMPITFHPGRWGTVWQKLKAGELDALPLVERIEKREDQVEFTQPHMIGYDSFFVPKAGPAIKSIEQARALSIIVLRLDASHHVLASHGFDQQLVFVDDLADGFRLLASGQHDAVLAPKLSGSRLVQSIGLEHIIKSGPLLKEYRREFCFAVRKGNTELRNRLDQGLAIVKASGEYDRLYRKWLGLYEAPTFPVKYVIWGAGITAALFSLLSLWMWTSHRQAERQRLHDVLQSLPVSVVLLAPDHQVVFANRFFEQRYGKAQGRRCHDYLFNRGKPCEVCDCFKMRKTDAPVNWQWTGPDGRDYEIHNMPFTDTYGSLMIMEVGIDVTEMKQARQALRETNASLEQRVAERTAELEAARREAEEARDLLRVTMDNAPALMSYIDRECRFRRVNKNYELWFGYSNKQLCGRHMREVLSDTAWQAITPYVERVLAGEQVAFELYAPYLKGDPCWIRATYSPDLDTTGRVRGFVVHVLDISKHKQAEEALREADHRKDEFLAMLAHELRNPLAPISNAARILKRSDLDETRLAWCRDVIDRQVEQLVRLVDDLLDVSRISRGKIELKKEPLAVAAIVQRAVETSQPLIEARRHELSVQLPSEPIVVEGDLVRLSQVVSNLLNNAAKYTDEGGRIRLAVEPADNEILIKVRDNGRGIDPSALPSLFQLFYQVDRTIDRSEGGLGIGLSLVNSLVTMHGGGVRATSAGRGQGSEFVVRLPTLPQALAVSVSPQMDLRPAGGPLRILVVDDNRDAAQSLSLLLTGEGHEVLLAYDGHAALEAALAEPPQVLLLDIGLPGMDGYAVARALRQHPDLKTAHLIALSGYGRQVDREQALTAGFNHYLTKPVNFDELQRALSQPAVHGQILS